MPTEQQVREAICCPQGCVRKSEVAGGCLAHLERYVQRGSAEAVMKLFAPKLVERIPFQFREDEE